VCSFTSFLAPMLRPLCGLIKYFYVYIPRVMVALFTCPIR
jgi:hypothetical protein